jgi:uncharacterized cupin superfamily protein
MDNRIKIVRKSDLEPHHQSGHEPFEYVKYSALSRRDGLKCVVAFYDIPPQKSNYPYHYHTNNTEVFYILSGEGLLRTPDGDRPVTAGDLIVFPPQSGGAHRLTNTSAIETLTYLDMDTANLPEVVYYPDSRKVAFIDPQENFAIYHEGSEADYYDGEG